MLPAMSTDQAKPPPLPGNLKRGDGFRLGFEASDWRMWMIIAAAALLILSAVIRLTAIPAGDGPGQGAVALGAALVPLACSAAVPGALLSIACAMRRHGVRRTLLTAAATAGVLMGALQVAASVAAAFNHRARESAAAQRRALSDAEADFVNHAQGVSQRSIEAAARFNTAGGLDPSTLATPADRAARLQLLKETRAVLEESLRLTEQFPQKARELAEARGASQNEAARVVAGLVRDARTVVRTRAIDVELCGVLERYVKLLDTHDGRWRLSPAGTTFDDERVQDEMRRIMAELQSLTREQSELANPRR